jgi:hypothetical protein
MIGDPNSLQTEVFGDSSKTRRYGQILMPTIDDVADSKGLALGGSDAYGRQSGLFNDIMSIHKQNMMPNKTVEFGDITGLSTASDWLFGSGGTQGNPTASRFERAVNTAAPILSTYFEWETGKALADAEKARLSLLKEEFDFNRQQVEDANARRGLAQQNYDKAQHRKDKQWHGINQH